MDHKEFDNILRNKLKQLEEPLAPGAWEQFHQKLVQAEGLSEAEAVEQGFDDVLRKRLEAIDPAYQPAHWAMMANQLDQTASKPELEDVEFDGLAYENLSELRPPYNSAHWAIMADRLDTEYALRQRVVRYKAVELALMLLLIFTIIQYFPNRHSIKKHQAVQQHIASVPVPEISDSHELLQTTVVSEQAQQQSGTISSSVASLPVRNMKALAASDFQQNSLPSQHTDMLLTNSRLEKVADEMALLHQETPVLANSLARSWRYSDVPGLESVPGLLAERQQALGRQELAMLERISQRAEGPEAQLPACDGCDRFKKERHLRIGMFASADANYVMTPYNPKKFLPAYDQFFPGYGGGISIAYSIGRWAFETGGIYSSMYYTPDQFRIDLNNGDFEEGWSGIGFKDAQLEIIKVPLNIRYEYANIRNWRFYAATGVTAHVAMYQQYSFQKQYKGDPSNNFFGPPPSPAPGEASPAEQQALYRGYLENGSLQENAYLSANLGIGLERFLSPRWSVFFQPNYQHQLFSRSKGFGPNEDRFNHLSTFLGLRATLK